MEGWRSIVRQIYAAVAAASQAARVDTFNGIYGMCNGLAASLVVLAVLTVIHGLALLPEQSVQSWASHGSAWGFLSHWLDKPSIL